MLKRIFLFLLVFSSLGAIAYTVFQNEHRVAIRHDIASAIPEDAVALIETDDLSALWDRLKDGNLIWEEIGFSTDVQEADRLGRALDSALFSDPTTTDILDGYRAYHSIHLGGGRSMQHLTVLPLDKELSLKRVQSFVAKHVLSTASFRDKDYEGAGISCIDSTAYCFTSYEGFLIFSDSQVLLERSIRAIDQGQGLAHDSGFKAIRETSGSDHEAYLYLNHSRLGELLNTFRRTEGKSPFFEQFAGWGEYDISLKSNALMMTGMVSASDSLSDYLSTFKDQGAVDMGICEWLPTTTAEFILLAITDKEKFEEQRGDYLQTIGRFNDRERKWKEMSEQSGIDQESVLDNMGDHVLAGRLEGVTSGTENLFAILPLAEEEELTASSLFNWGDDYRGVTVSEKTDCRFLEACFGRFFLPLRSGWAAEMEGHLLLADSEKTLRSLIDFRLSDRTLAKSEAFQNFLQTISDEAALTYYFDPGRGVGLLSSRLDPDLAEDLLENEQTLKQFQGVCVQYEHARDDLFYQNLYFNHNPVYKKETASVWETRLDTTFSDRIWAVENHRNGQQEAFVQDDAGQVYLLSNTGKQLWTRQLGETIRSEVEQVDMYRNGRLQLLFNTDTRIYLIDRLGRDVEGYPIELPAKATTRLAVMDYDGNKRYRLLIGTEEGMLHNFDVTGKAVKGWEYQLRGAPLVGRIRHFTIGSMDYISCIDSAGDLFYLDRAGKLRHDASQDMTDYDSGAYLIRTGKDIGTTKISYRRRDGDFWTMSSDGADEALSMELDSTQGLAWNRSARIFLLDGDEVHWQDGVHGEEKDFELGEYCDRLQLMESGTETWVLGQSTAHRTSYLYRGEGVPVSGFPINGSTRAVVQDMDGDGNSDLLIGDGDGVVYMYSLSL